MVLLLLLWQQLLVAAVDVAVAVFLLLLLLMWQKLLFALALAVAVVSLLLMWRCKAPQKVSLTHAIGVNRLFPTGKCLEKIVARAGRGRTVAAQSANKS